MKTIVTILKNHTVVIPATQLETWVDGKVVSSIPVPESKTEYVAGQTLSFRSKKDANAFMRALNGDKLEAIAGIKEPHCDW